MHFLLFCVLVSGSLRPVSGCCRGVQYWIVWEILQLRNAWFDSGYMFCISAWRLRTTVHIFYGEVDSDPEVFFSVLLQNGEVCSVEASVFSLVTHSSHLEPG